MARPRRRIQIFNATEDGRLSRLVSDAPLATALEIAKRLSASANLRGIEDFIASALRRQDADALKIPLCEIVSRVAPQCRTFRRRMHTLGCTNKIGRFLPEPAAFKALADLTLNDETVRNSVSSSAAIIAAVVENIHSEPALNLAAALTEKNSVSSLAIARLGGIAKLLAVIAVMKAPACNIASLVLSNIVHGNSQHKNAIVELGGLTTLARLLSTGDRHAALIIGQIASVSGAARVALGQLGCVNFLGSMLSKSNDVSVGKFALFALGRLALDDTNQAAIIIGGLIPYVGKLFTRGDVDMKHYAAYVLTMIASTRCGKEASRTIDTSWAMTLRISPSVQVRRNRGDPSRRRISPRVLL